MWISELGNQGQQLTITPRTKLNCYEKQVSRAMRKCVLCHMRTTKAQVSLRISAVWSAPLLFAA